MNYIKALICFGLFSGLSYAVLTGALPGKDGGSSKTQALKSIIGRGVEEFGVVETGLGLLGIGFALTAYFTHLARRAAT